MHTQILYTTKSRTASVAPKLDLEGCASCRLSDFCLSSVLESSDLRAFDAFVQRKKPLHKGMHVYRQNQAFDSIYMVRSGVLKAYTNTQQGDEQVVGFLFPGDLFGIDGMSTNRHIRSVTALDTSSVCQIPFAAVHELSRQAPGFQNNLFRIMSREIMNYHQHMMLLTKLNALQRVATLLLYISEKYERLNYSSDSFPLNISRRDLACHLGLTLETVSRMFSALQKQGLIQVHGKSVIIFDRENLVRASKGE